MIAAKNTTKRARYLMMEVQQAAGERAGFPKEPRCFKHQEVLKTGKIWLLLTMEFNEGEFLIKRAPNPVPE